MRLLVQRSAAHRGMGADGVTLAHHLREPADDVGVSRCRESRLPLRLHRPATGSTPDVDARRQDCGRCVPDGPKELGEDLVGIAESTALAQWHTGQLGRSQALRAKRIRVVGHPPDLARELPTCTELIE